DHPTNPLMGSSNRLPRPHPANPLLPLLHPALPRQQQRTHQHHPASHPASMEHRHRTHPIHPTPPSCHLRCAHHHHHGLITRLRPAPTLRHRLPHYRPSH